MTLDPPEGQSYSWALAQLEKGHQVMRLQWWESKDCPHDEKMNYSPYLQLLLLPRQLMRFPKEGTGSQYPYEMSMQDKEANDWVRY